MLLVSPLLTEIGMSGRKEEIWEKSFFLSIIPRRERQK